jgi:putative hydrolase of the HAD superfamily
VSSVAEFARVLHERHPAPPEGFREFVPISYPSIKEKLFDVRAVIFDVYGTLIEYWKPEFSDKEAKQQALLAAFRNTADYFGMKDVLVRMNPADAPEKTLHDFYHGLIALQQEKSVRSGIEFPEIRIEEIWGIIILMLQRHGYDPTTVRPGETSDLSRTIAYYYNFHALGRGLYPGVVTMLEDLRKNNIRVGIVSNAQFYTPVDLTLLIRQQSDGRYDDYLELFDLDLIFYSYEYGAAKPDQLLLGKLFDALYEYQILPSQTVFVGNDLTADIQPALSAGMQTGFFTGDKRCAFLHGEEGAIIPHITIPHWSDLAAKISFYEEKV